MGVSIGYVHGEEPVDEAVKDGKAVGLLLPKLDKTRFLETVHAIGTLPRKAFSMGEANEKRFYIEARNILPEDERPAKLSPVKTARRIEARNILPEDERPAK